MARKRTNGQKDLFSGGETAYGNHFDRPASVVSKTKVDEICSLVRELADCPIDERVNALNAIREELHKISPFASEPVDFVRWVHGDSVSANDSDSAEKRSVPAIQADEAG